MASDGSFMNLVFWILAEPLHILSVLVFEIKRLPTVWDTLILLSSFSLVEAQYVTTTVESIWSTWIEIQSFFLLKSFSTVRSACVEPGEGGLCRETNLCLFILSHSFIAFNKTIKMYIVFEKRTAANRWPSTGEVDRRWADSNPRPWGWNVTTLISWSLQLGLEVPLADTESTYDFVILEGNPTNLPQILSLVVFFAKVVEL